MAGPETRRGSKVMTAAEAVARFITPGCTIGMGGQSVARIPMALAHAIARQGAGDLTLVGCNLAMAMDWLVGAGLVRRTEAGSGSLERFGTAFRWRAAVEAGTLQHVDYSHLGMVTRFLAGEMGVPFMPVRSMLGSDLLGEAATAGGMDFHVMASPWDPAERVVLLPALRPDVAIVHVQKADAEGNAVTEGVTIHEPEMVRAARAVIVSCEEVVDTAEVRRYPEATTIPALYVSAVVEQPFGAYPSSVYRYYDYDEEHFALYQAAARQGGAAYQAYLDRYVYGCATWDEVLEQCGGLRRMHALRQRMLRIL